VTVHYIRYHKKTAENQLTNQPGAFIAWAKSRPTQPRWRPPVDRGDTVWIMSGQDMGGRKKTYQIECFFRAIEEAQPEGDRLVLRSNEGTLFRSPIRVDHLPWFDTFLTKIGNGGTSFQRIPPDNLPFFLELMRSHAGSSRLEEMLDQAVDAGHKNDAIVLRAIKTRRGQPEFRTRILDAYARKCCFTGCAVEDVLEAAHIVSHATETNYSVSNGLLLRADVHTLFDLDLVGVDEDYQIRVSATLKASEYGALDGQRMRLPNAKVDWPDGDGLSARLQRLPR
jgi:hypothetical protein